ncbi:MAG: hypothetical protein ACI8WB_000163 [Phenylobacterium sp.]|jgi:hypothetical protein
MANMNGAKKGLSNKQIGDICTIIIAWPNEKLTWQRLTSAIEQQLSISVTRQCLSSYFAIAKEYQLQKEALRSGTHTQNRLPTIAVSEQKLMEKIERLEKEKSFLQRQCNLQLEKIKCMIHNAQRHNPRIDIRELMLPLGKTIKE